MKIFGKVIFLLIFLINIAEARSVSIGETVSFKSASLGCKTVSALDGFFDTPSSQRTMYAYSNGCALLDSGNWIVKDKASGGYVKVCSGSYCYWADSYKVK